jgi:hypothetical protein
MHSSILFRLLYISQCFLRISNFFSLSNTEETWVVEMRIWSIKIGVVLILHFNQWVEASVGGLQVPEGFYSPIDKYLGTCLKISIWIKISRLIYLLIIYVFTPRSRIFHSYGDVTVAGERLRNLGLYLALRAFEQEGIFIVPHLLWHGTSVFPVSAEGPPHLVASYDTRGDVEDLF